MTDISGYQWLMGGSVLTILAFLLKLTWWTSRASKDIEETKKLSHPTPCATAEHILAAQAQITASQVISSASQVMLTKAQADLAISMARVETDTKWLVAEVIKQNSGQKE